MIPFAWKRHARLKQQNYAGWKIVIALMFMAALMGCQKSAPDNAEQRSPEPLQKITVAYTYQPQSTLVHVAVAKGYFTEEGLDAQSLMHTYGKAALQSVIENKADFATVAETPVMFSVLKGEKIFVIANIEASSMNNAIVARKDVGIISPGDLKGKRVGYTPGTTSDFFLDSLLTANGLTRQEIKPVALKPEEMQEAIGVQEMRGRIRKQEKMIRTRTVITVTSGVKRMRCGRKELIWEVLMGSLIHSHSMENNKKRDH